MTEQEQRLFEMYRELSSEGCEHPHELYAFCITAVNEGYRKEDEVQKETLQKLFYAIKTSGKLFDSSGYLRLGFWAIDLDDIHEVIEQEFGVDVE